MTAAPAATVRIHPRMADTWQERIRALIAGLTEPDREGEAREAIRGLIEKIVVLPSCVTSSAAMSFLLMFSCPA